MIRVAFKTVLILCTVPLVMGTTHAEDSDLAKLFTEGRVNGTLVVSSLDGKNCCEKGIKQGNTFFTPRHVTPFTLN